MGWLAGLLILILDIVAIFSVLGSGRSPASKILWTVVILIFPLIGMAAYFLFGRDRAGIGRL